MLEDFGMPNLHKKFINPARLYKVRNCNFESSATKRHEAADRERGRSVIGKLGVTKKFRRYQPYYTYNYSQLHQQNFDPRILGDNIIELNRNSSTQKQSFSIDVVAVEICSLEEDWSWLVSELFCQPRGNLTTVVEHKGTS